MNANPMNTNQQNRWGNGWWLWDDGQKGKSKEESNNTREGGLQMSLSDMKLAKLAKMLKIVSNSSEMAGHDWQLEKSLRMAQKLDN